MSKCKAILISGVCDAYGIGMNGQPCPYGGDTEVCEKYHPGIANQRDSGSPGDVAKVEQRCADLKARPGCHKCGRSIPVGEVAAVVIDGRTHTYCKEHVPTTDIAAPASSRPFKWEPKPTTDAAHQDHYEAQPVQPIEALLSILTPEQMVGFLAGNVVKYAMRAGRKAGTDDAAKAATYRRWLAEYRATGWIAQFPRPEAS